MEDAPGIENKKPEPIGPFAAIIIVVLILAIGGIYFFLNAEKKLRHAPPLEYYNQA